MVVMRKLLATLGAVGALVLLGAPVAAALPQEVGDRCAANGTMADTTAIVLNNSLEYGQLPPVVPPEGAKVITRWKVNAPPGTEPISQQLVALKQVGEESDQLVGESALETVVGGAANEFTTRIPVPEYAHVGLRGPSGALTCEDTDGHLGGLVEGPWATGESREFEIKFLGVPVIAYVEVDRDADGYGDETQDLCPALASVQAACPIALTASAKVTGAAILLTVSTGPPARVYVNGQVGWGFKPKGGGKRKRLIVGLAGGAQEVGYLASATFTVPLPKAVKRRLGKLAPKQSLKAKLDLEAIEIAGAPATLKSLTVKLPGRKKPARPRR